MKSLRDLALTAEQKAYYNEEAKRYKQGVKNGSIPTPALTASSKKSKPRPELDLRQDTAGRLVANRYSVEDELRQRRENERRLLSQMWPPGKDVIDEKFYLVAFHSLCKLPNNEYLPCEVACVEYSLSQGIQRSFHAFLNPGGIPLGFRYMCQEHSDRTHQIPVDGHEEAKSDYHSVWRELTAFVNPDNKGIIPPLFCESAQRDKVEWCLRWLADRAGISNCLRKVFELELVMSELYTHNDRVANSWTIMQEMMRSSCWDHIPDTRCDFHEELSSILDHCALGLANKYCYILSNPIAADVYSIPLTEKHIPERPDLEAVGSMVYPAVRETVRQVNQQSNNWQQSSRRPAPQPSHPSRMPQQSQERPPRFQRQTEECYQPIRRPAASDPPRRAEPTLTQKYYANNDPTAPSPSSVPMPEFDFEPQEEVQNGNMDYDLSQSFQTSMTLSTSPTTLSLAGIGRGIGRGMMAPSSALTSYSSQAQPAPQTYQPVCAGIGRGRGFGRGTPAF